MSLTSNKPLTISLQNLNTLYFKFIDQYILQYLPKNILTDVNTLLSMKSAIQAYRYLDNKLNNHNLLQHNNAQSYKNQYKNNNNNNELNTKQQPKNNRKTSHSKQNTGSHGNIIITQNNSNIDRNVYLLEDNDNEKTKRINSLLKRANTYGQSQQKKQDDIFSNVAIMGEKNNKLQHKNNNDVIGQGSMKRITNDNRNNSFNLRTKHQHSQANFNKDKHNFNGNNNTSSQHGGSTNKIQFAKTYSTREVIVNDNHHNNSYLTKPQSNTINRSKLLTLVKQTRQIFADNAKKILRYENLSSDLAAMQQLKSDNGSNKGYTTTINDVNSGYNGNNNNYEYGNFNTGGKKY